MLRPPPRAAALRMQPPRLSGDQDGSLPMDYERLQEERQLGKREVDDKPATAMELAAHLPSWAADILLDPDANNEYESTQANARARELNARRVEGRTWEELEVTNMDGEGAGMSEFTAEELAEDYQLPLETIIAALLSYGVDPKRLRIDAPVKSVCAAQQLTELLHFVGSADPIACREELCESTLEELAEAPDATLTNPEDWLRLCRTNSISANLGVMTRVLKADLPALLDAAEREAAFIKGRDLRVGDVSSASSSRVAEDVADDVEDEDEIEEEEEGDDEAH